ncbi:MAG: MFS transporter [Parvularcula sp.]|nr:MFS transporter [Parvularcula sp.]
MKYEQGSSRKGYGEFRLHWRSLAAVTIAASFGFPTLAFFSIGVFAPIMAEKFNWSFSAMMGGITLASVVILICGPAVGRMIDRRGPRRIAAFSLAAFGLSYMTLALSSGSLVQYYVSWALISITGIGATAISFTHIINTYFQERRGLALGIALSSSGISAMIVKPLAGVIIGLFGWREAIFLIGFLPLLIGVPALLWGVPKDAAGGLEEQARQTKKNLSMEGVSLRQALSQRPFWILLAAFAAIAFANGAPIPNLENILKTHNFAAADIIALTSLIGASLIIGRVFGGWLIDHFWAPLVGLVLLICAAGGCWLLSQQGVSHFEAMMAVILLSLAAGVEYDLLSFLVARYLGRRNYGAIYSVLFGVFAISTGFGPVVLGSFYDHQGSYASGLLICAILLVAAGFTLLTLGRYPTLPKASGE